MPGGSPLAKPALLTTRGCARMDFTTGRAIMPRTWVLVPTDAGETQPVFVNGPAQGGVTNAAFRVEVGFNDFTLREGGVTGGKVTSRKRENCPARHTQANPFPVILLPVPAAPPPAFGMAPAPRLEPAKKKAARKKTAKRKVTKRKVAKRKIAKKPAKRKTAPKRKAARKTAARRKRR